MRLNDNNHTSTFNFYTLVELELVSIFAAQQNHKQNKTMKPIQKFLIVLLCGLLSSVTFAQVTVKQGPGLDNDRDNTMNRMLNGDDNSFYCYRVRSKGRGTSFYVEKYDNKTLKPLFSKEINDENEDDYKFEDVRYAAGNVYVFRRKYDKEGDKMTLYYQSISSSGVVSKKQQEIVMVNSDHYEFVDFDVYSNPSNTKFLIKACHKANKEDDYKTDFILLDANGMKTIWTKTVNQQISNKSNNLGASIAGLFGVNVKTREMGLLGMFLDDKDNVFYCYTVPDEKKDKKSKRTIHLMLSFINASEKAPKDLELQFDDSYQLGDIEFSKSKENEIVVGGFLKDVIERRGADLVKVGIFSFTIDQSSASVTAHTVKLFDDKMLTALESNPKRSKYFNYKMDYIMPIGDAVYYIGEQYNLTMVTQSSGYGSSSTHYDYEYMDVIIGKLNSKGEFEWVKNVPLRNAVTLGYRHVFKQYIAAATDKNIYIMCDDHPKNMERYAKADYEPRDLKTVSGIHGSSFVYNAVSVSDGSIKRGEIFKNETYCFAPIQERNIQFVPPASCEIFTKGKNNELYIYTEDRGRDRFATLKLQ